MINIDMVGRLSEQGLLVGGVGSSPAWMPLLERLGNRGMPILYDASVTSRSDHANFYRKDIPVLFFFTGVHDDYHAPGDEISRINRQGLATIAELVHDVVVELAAGHDVPFERPRTASEGLVRALPGDNPDTIVKRIAG
jgi:Zn-dependent M28 family amino/carboxypeptidase